SSLSCHTPPILITVASVKTSCDRWLGAFNLVPAQARKKTFLLCLFRNYTHTHTPGATDYFCGRQHGVRAPGLVPSSAWCTCRRCGHECRPW
ncbi:unnamed protein product, partial [Ectocarpus sp. 8 AP-2014]